MKVDIPDESLPLLIRAVENYEAYLAATDRPDPRFPELLERLKGKPVEAERATKKATRKRA